LGDTSPHFSAVFGRHTFLMTDWFCSGMTLRATCRTPQSIPTDSQPAASQARRSTSRPDERRPLFASAGFLDCDLWGVWLVFRPTHVPTRSLRNGVSPFQFATKRRRADLRCGDVCCHDEYLTAIALVVCVFPGRRSMRVNPINGLRNE